MPGRLLKRPLCTPDRADERRKVLEYAFFLALLTYTRKTEKFQSSARLILVELSKRRRSHQKATLLSAAGVG